MELIPLFVKLFGPTLARMLFAYVLKEKIELDFIQPGDIAETLADSLDIVGIVNRLTNNDRTASRNAPYIFEKIGDEVAEKLVEIYKVEKESFDNNSFELVVEAAKDTLNRYSVPLLLETNFDPVRFRNELSKKPPKFPAFSSKQLEFYSQLLNAAALYVFAVADQTPNFTRDTTARLLQNESELLNDMRKALTNQEHLLSQTFGRQMTTDAQLFEAEYRSQLVSALDKLRLFGINNIDGARQPLTIAFVKMKMILEDFGEEQDKLKPRQLNFFDLNRGENIDVETMFSSHTRLAVVAKAGFGKTTLLKWAAVQLARHLPDLKVDTWQGKIPFFVQLRDYAKQELPTIAELPMSLKATEIELLEGSVPTNWSTKQIRAKRTIIFLDGLDETNEPKRQEALAWVEGILSLYPETVFIISGRPSAINKQEMQPELQRLGFHFVTLKEMDEDMINQFVRQWHAAIMHAHCKYTEKETVPQREAKILATFQKREDLRSMASTPLICAMLCALNLSKLGELPKDRIRLYDECIDILLKRDELREVDISGYGVNLSPTNARRLLAKIAYWMMENDESRIDRNDAERLINNTGLDGPKLTTFLAERTGILQKQSEDVFDFLHRSFQEFLAAQQIVADNDVTKVARQYGAEKSWRETICLLAGTAEWNDQQKLLNALLELAHKNTKQNRYFHLLAWEFWELLGETTQEANAIIQRHSLGLCKNQSLTLNLSYTQVTDLSPLAGLSELQSLYLSSTQVTDLSPLAGLSELQSLSLMNTQVTDLSPLAGLSELQSLYLSSTQVTDLSPLAGLSELQSLYLSSTQVTDLSPLAGLITLKSVYVQSSNVFDTSPLAHLSDLKIRF